MADVYFTIPIWFFGWDSLTYTLSAIFGFLVSYYAQKLYKISNNRTHYLLHLAFTILSVGLITLGLASFFAHSNLSVQSAPLVETVIGVSNLGYYLYFLCSLISYAVLAYIYNKDWKPAIFMLPAWYGYYHYFNFLSLFLLFFVIFRVALNFISKKSLNSFLVLLSFVFFFLYHISLLLLPFTELVYVIAHIFLILGFSSLILMLRRVAKT